MLSHHPIFLVLRLTIDLVFGKGREIICTKENKKLNMSMSLKMLRKCTMSKNRRLSCSKDVLDAVPSKKWRFFELA